MSHAKNKINWCLNKAEKELKETGKHRGLIQIKPDKILSLKHITKAEHYLLATEHLKKDFSDLSTGTAFYAMYHCLLAIAVKFGYQSRNQECTFALMHNLSEEKKIDLSKDLLDKITEIDSQRGKEESTSTEIREEYQYGTKLSIDEVLYEKLFILVKEVLLKTKEIVEK